MGEVSVLKPRSLVSALLGRFQFLQRAGITFGGRRDLYEAFGYARELTARDFRDRYSRDGIAARLIDCYPKATWRDGAYLQEDEDPDVTTPFEQAWEDFDKRLGVWSMFERVDRLARLGTYAVLLIGAPDGDLEQELPRGKSTDQVLFLAAFSGGGGPGASGGPGTVGDANFVDATIQEFVTDPRDERFGLPAVYQLRRVDATAPALQRNVHWSRVVHVAEGLLDNDVFGTPQLLDVWNRFDDLDKVTGGGAEAFFQRANKGLNLNLDKDVEMQAEDAKRLSAEVEDYVHGVTRVLKTRAIDVRELGSDVANFSQPADAIIAQIAGAKGIPKRILMGSEMGQLASGQDRDNWDTQVQDRRTSYAEPRIVRPFVKRLIDYGYLPEPEEYDVVWPDISNLTEAEKADGAVKWAQANSTAAITVFTGEEIRDHWYGMDPLTPEQLAAAKEQRDIEAPPEPMVVTPDGKLAKARPGEGKPPFGFGKKPGEEKEKPAARAAEDAGLAADVGALVDAIEAALGDGDPGAVLGALGLEALGDRPGHPFHGNQWTDASGAAAGDPVAALAAGLRPAPDYRNAGFVLPDGTLLAKRYRSQSHWEAAEEAGVGLDDAMAAGVIRMGAPGAAEIGAPITDEQARGLVDSAHWGAARLPSFAYHEPGSLFLDVRGPGGLETRSWEPGRATPDAVRAWVNSRFAGPAARAAGDRPGHEFHGNQWVAAGGMEIGSLREDHALYFHPGGRPIGLSRLRLPVPGPSDEEARRAEGMMAEAAAGGIRRAPVVARAVPGEGGHEVLSGAEAVAVARRHGWGTIPVRLVGKRAWGRGREGQRPLDWDQAARGASLATTDRALAEREAARTGGRIEEIEIGDGAGALEAAERELGMRIYVVGEPRVLGGPGSGHFGHAGRPGHVGGSQRAGAPTGREIADAAIISQPSSEYPPLDPAGADTQAMYSDGRGNYTPERRALHEAIVRKILRGTTPVEGPTAWFVGGGMASGKSTLTGSLTWENTVMINPDVVRDQLPEWQETLAAALSKGEQSASVSFTHEEASDISREIIIAARAGSRNMMLDAVGDSSLERLSEKIALMGPSVDAIYVTIPVDLAQQRADNRARTTDRRFVQPTFMRAAHAMVSRIYPEAVRNGVFRTTQLFETSHQGYPKWIASSRGKQLTIYDQGLYDEFLAKAGLAPGPPPALQPAGGGRP